MQEIAVGRPRKAEARSPAVFEGRQFRRGGDAQWQTRIPQRIVARLRTRGYFVQDVSRLSVVRPGQSKSKDQVISEPYLISDIWVEIRLAKIQIWIPGSNANSIRRICGERREVRELERTVIVDEHGNRCTHLSDINTQFPGVPSG